MSRGMFAAVLGLCSLFFKRMTRGTADSRRAFKENIVSSILRTKGEEEEYEYESKYVGIIGREIGLGGVRLNEGGGEGRGGGVGTKALSSASSFHLTGILESTRRNLGREHGTRIAPSTAPQPSDRCGIDSNPFIGVALSAMAICQGSLATACLSETRNGSNGSSSDVCWLGTGIPRLP